mgnify:CR=1 FL=1
MSNQNGEKRLQPIHVFMQLDGVGDDLGRNKLGRGAHASLELSLSLDSGGRPKPVLSVKAIHDAQAGTTTITVQFGKTNITETFNVKEGLYR